MTVVMDHHPPARALAWPYTDEATLGTLPVAVPAARVFVAKTLAGWGLGALIEDACLVASELVTNAVKASWPFDAGESVKLWLMADGSNLIIEVYDGCPEMPQERPAGDGEGGRGLAIVAALSVSWGVYAGSLGKTVWAHLRQDGPSGRLC
jgi:anti-sigma regulatory factor (Ser/Thr protein kinase)